MSEYWKSTVSATQSKINPKEVRLTPAGSQNTGANTAKSTSATRSLKELSMRQQAGTRGVSNDFSAIYIATRNVNSGRKTGPRQRLSASMEWYQANYLQPRIRVDSAGIQDKNL